MEAKMPEKWTKDGIKDHNDHEIVDQHNIDVEAAFAAGLEAGKAQAATKPAEPRFAVGDRVLCKGKPDTVLAIDIDGLPVNGNEIWYGFSGSMWAHESSLAVAPAEPAPMVLTAANKAIGGGK